MGRIFASCGHELKSINEGVPCMVSDSDGEYSILYCKSCAVADTSATILGGSGIERHYRHDPQPAMVESPQLEQPQVWEAAAQYIANDIVKVLTTRQNDYGQGNILGFGEKGILVRIWDKVNRLKNLLWDKEEEPKGERVEDTFIDLAGYAILALMLRKGWFTLPLKQGK